MARRKSLPLEVRKLVLHECGYKCANPACRGILTLDIHHIEFVSEGGSDSPDNLLPLCPNCHALHHAGHIPVESLRTWKMLLLSLNEGFDRKSIDLLLALHKVGTIRVSGDGLLNCAALIASNLVSQTTFRVNTGDWRYSLDLTEKGRLLIDAWKHGSQEAALNSVKSITEGHSNL